MAESVHFPLEVFYDGSCHICAAEIANYRRVSRDDRLLFIDISAPYFVAAQYGRSQQQFMDRLHVRDGRGEFFTGVDAFLCLWLAYPAPSLYRLLGALISLPGVNLAARTGYWFFARYRHLLPKRKSACPSWTCNLNHPR